MRRFVFALAAVTLTAAGDASAQDKPDAAQEEPIIVTGRTLPAKAVHSYVRQISSSVDGQMTRFADPVCPTVTGLPDHYNDAIIRRIRKLAGEAGVPVAKEKCRANMVVVIATDADSFVDTLRHKHSYLFEGVDEVDLRSAFRPGPVHAWNTTQIQDEDGRWQREMVKTVKSASILTMPTQHVILGSVIVIDDGATLGKSLAQIADYTAMRALVGARPPREGLEADTIMTLFDGRAEAPPAATAVDRSYLKGLYEAPANASAIVTMGRISKRIRRDAEARGEAPN